MKNRAKFFSPNYREARKKFLKTAEQNNLKIETYTNPKTGYDGESLHTDVLWIGSRNAENILVTTSGTHGPEGHLGSAAQIAALSEGLYANLHSNMAVLVIHAINPWGFSWTRRCNEDGVDLFRNFIDFDMPLPENEIYDALVKYIVPKSDSLKDKLTAELGLAYSLLRFGKEKLRKEIPRGQYRHAYGPFFGGFEPTWSNKILRQIIREYLSNARMVMAIDYHTGLGEYGIGELVGFEHPEADEYQIAKSCWGDSYVSVYSSDTVAFEIFGILPNAYKAELPNAQVVFGAYEFGTIDEKKVFKILRADHSIYKHEEVHAGKVIKIREQMQHAFNCDSDIWREKVLEQTINAEREALLYCIRQRCD